MLQYIITPAAAYDIFAILEHSQHLFGKRARLRYESLILQCIQDLRDNPLRLGCTPHPQLGAGIFSYHMNHSRKRISQQHGRVHSPRHFLVCRVDDTQTLIVIRVVHDRMSLNASVLHE